MKRMLLSVVVVAVLFGLSAAGSWMWHRANAPAGEAAGVPLEPASAALAFGKGHGTPAPEVGEGPAPRVAARPAYSPDAEDAARLAASLREKLAAVAEREAQLTARQKQFELVAKDIHGEQAAMDDLRKQVAEEAKAVEAQLTKVEQRAAELEQQRQTASGKVAELEQRLIQLEGAERKNIEKMADIYNSMEPESAAKILTQLANSGSLDTAVKVLGVMKERQAAKVLAQLPEPMAAQLLDKLKGFRRVPPAPPK